MAEESPSSGKKAIPLIRHAMEVAASSRAPTRPMKTRKSDQARMSSVKRTPLGTP